jgi:hypothetical protein
VRWLPDSSGVLTARPARVDEDGWGWLDGPVDLLRVDVEGTADVLAHAGENSVVWEQFPNGMWSADSSRLAYFGIRPTSTPDAYPAVEGPLDTFESVTPKRALYAAESPELAPMEIDQVDGAQVLWAPDGSALLYRPRALMGYGSWSHEDWHLARPGEPPEPRADLGHHVSAWLGTDQVLLAEPLKNSATTGLGPREPARLVAQALDGRWREFAASARLWAVNSEEGVLRLR